MNHPFIIALTRQGAAAAKAGAAFLDSPYPYNTKDWHSWNCGYIDNEDF